MSNKSVHEVAEELADLNIEKYQNIQPLPQTPTKSTTTSFKKGLGKNSSTKDGGASTSTTNPQVGEVEDSNKKDPQNVIQKQNPKAVDKSNFPTNSKQLFMELKRISRKRAKTAANAVMIYRGLNSEQPLPLKYRVVYNVQLGTKDDRYDLRTKAALDQCTEEMAVIYCLTCGICGKQYVGETKRKFTIRYWEHIKGIEKQKPTPVGYHFNFHNHSSLDVIPSILEVIDRDPSLESSTKYRKDREKFWIYRLRSLVPLGINVDG